MLRHGDVDEGVDDGVDEGEEEEDDAVVVDGVRELEKTHLEQGLHYEPATWKAGFPIFFIVDKKVFFCDTQ